MDPTTAVVMVLLSCNQGTSHCQPSQTEPVVYSSIADCNEELRARLAPWPDGEMIGRCKRVDTTATGSVPDGYKAVQVTRGIGDDFNTTTYFVLKSEN